MADINCENCSGTGTSFGKPCPCLEPAQTRLAKLLVSKLDLQYEVATDVLSIAGVRYAATMFRQLGGVLPVGQLFSIVSRRDGVLTVQRHIAAERPGRVYTYVEQPQNVPASQLGEAARRTMTKPGGDSIDTGLQLLLELQNIGYGVAEVPGLARLNESGEIAK